MGAGGPGSIPGEALFVLKVVLKVVSKVVIKVVVKEVIVVSKFKVSSRSEQE